MGATQGRRMRGTLIAACSAVTTIGAHTGAGGALPHGSPLIVAILLCATTGALLGCARIDGRWMRSAAVVGGLVAAQLLGHLTLAVTGGHQMPGTESVLSAPMAAAHLAGAVVLGMAIAAVEYLCAVCTSVLCWLRLFAIRMGRPALRIVRRATNPVAPQRVLPLSGLGMRAPPAVVGTSA